MNLLERILNDFHLIIAILFSIFLIVSVSYSNLFRFSKWILNIAFSLITCTSLFWLINYIFNTKVFSGMNADGTFAFIVSIISALSWFAYFLLFLGVSFLVGKDLNSEPEQKQEVQMKKTNTILMLVYTVITAGIYIFFWIYRLVKDLRQNFKDEVPYSPGRAVGFLFIPVFNIYWAIYIYFSLPRIISKIEKKYYSKLKGFHFHPVLISVTLLLTFITGILYNIISEDVSGVKALMSTMFYTGSITITFWITMQAKVNALIE